jgi:hypothetical protein
MLTFWPKRKHFQVVSNVAPFRALDILSSEIKSNDKSLFESHFEQFLNTHSALATSKLVVDFKLKVEAYKRIEQILIESGDSRFLDIFLNLLSSERSLSLVVQVVYRLWSEKKEGIVLLGPFLSTLVKTKFNNDHQKETKVLVDNLTELVVALNDLELVKIYIKKLILFAVDSSSGHYIEDGEPKDLLNVAIGLMDKFKWRSLFAHSMIFDFVKKDNSIQYIEKNCKLAQVFCNFCYKIFFMSIFYNQ